MAEIVERSDVRWVCVQPATDNDDGIAYLIGYQDVTAIKIVARHGPLDWLPYIEVWQGDHLHAEIPQYRTACIEFSK